MFLNNPQNVTGNYGRIVEKFGIEIFHQDHEYFAYYVSALSYYELEKLLSENKLLPKSKRFRYHILMVFRFLITKVITPNLKDKGKTKRTCNDILNILKDENEKFEMFKLSAKIIESEELGINFEDRKSVERKDTTDLILEFLVNEYLRQ